MSFTLEMGLCGRKRSLRSHQVSNSDSHEVTLLNVSREMTGYYKCEITEDYPSYHTVILGGRMQVVVVPEEKPLLILGRPRPSPGDKMIANCTSGAAYPAPNITWTINGSPVGINPAEKKVV
ncbi:uncharacterized protein [Fopius arisanus]|uniref:Ig-like domain-containing protein n=1 Tax=Fopius arisanus TaxID=64838 RepID=A0A9R1TQ56_9HYME|nr:PREDICTED: uncharacterized protein LOC105272568 [Fopius arisanus]